MLQTLAEIEHLVDAANVAYYRDGRSIMEDARYDALMNQLATLDPQNPRLARVGVSVRDSILTKRAHAIPMGSQSKATTREEFDSWCTLNLSRPLGVPPSALRLRGSLKLDGLSFSIEYQGGRPVTAISRGDGKVGEDLTANALKFQQLPRYCALNGLPFSGHIRAEILLHVEDWEQVDEEKASNPRNCAAGIARRKSGEQSEVLRAYTFRVFGPDGTPLGATETEQAAILEAMGFTTAPGFTGSPDEIWQWYQAVQDERQSSPYWIDGVVCALDQLDLQLSLGETDNRPKGQVAIKFAAEGAETTLLGVTFQVGHTQAIVPVGEFAPVQIGGTTVKSATLCNMENIETLGVAIRDKVLLIKAGDIIPRVMEVVAPARDRIPIVEPAACPACGGAVGRRTNVSGDASVHLYCQNPDCPAKITGKLARYLSSLDILGVGDELITALVKDLGVRDPANLYALHARKAELAALLLSGKVRLGEKRAVKFLAEIEKRRALSLSDFLGSLGVFGLGKRRVALIQQAVPGQMDTLDDWLSGKLVTLAEAASVPNIAERITADLQALKPLIAKSRNGVVLQETGGRRTPEAMGAETICITGKLSREKSVFAGLITQAGHTYTDSFSKAVTILVAADPASGSSKLEKAAKQGIRVLSEAELLSLLHVA